MNSIATDGIPYPSEEQRAEHDSMQDLVPHRGPIGGFELEIS